MALLDTRPTEDDVYPSEDATAPCKLCGSDVQGTDGIWRWWGQHLQWHQDLWDALNPA